VRYACIHRRRRRHSVRMMCRLLEVSRSGYYDWCTRAESARSRRNRELLLMIRQLHLESNGVYGARKIHRELLLAGEACGRHRVARLMRKDRLKGCPKRRFIRALNTTADHPVADNLLKQDFRADGPNQRWASDITQVWTREGWLYLAVVMDLYSRRIVGWCMDRDVGRHLVVGALTMALGYRQPEGPLLHHSDRGPQYTSDDFRDICRDNNIECSMSARGSCYDNAVVESFFASLKRERCRRTKYKTREEAKADIFDYIERFYNRKRSHSYLGYLSPVQYEKQAVGT
jgi:putative transposase